jgi:hypothetical protein
MDFNIGNSVEVTFIPLDIISKMSDTMEYAGNH